MTYAQLQILSDVVNKDTALYALERKGLVFHRGHGEWRATPSGLDALDEAREGGW